MQLVALYLPAHIESRSNPPSQINILCSQDLDETPKRGRNPIRLEGFNIVIATLSVSCKSSIYMDEDICILTKFSLQRM